MPSLASLLTPTTEDQVLSAMLSLLQLAGFPVMSWAAQAVVRRVLRAVARGVANLSSLIPLLARAGYATLALGAWLDLFIESFYGISRDPAVFTIGTLVLEDIGGVGPITFSVGQLWAVSNNGKRYTNTTGGTLVAGGTIVGGTALSLTFQAEHEGSDYNVASGDISALLTPIPGVKISNPVIGSTGTWITQQGADEETDVEYLTRAEGKWSTTGKGGNNDTYAYWAKQAAPNVRRVNVLESTPVPGDVTLYLATDDGPASSTDVALVQAYFASTVGHVLDVNVQVFAAIAHPITLSGAPQIPASGLSGAITSWTTAFTAYRKTVPVGGTIVIDQIVQLIMDQGATNILSLLPAADVVLASNEVAVFTDSLVWTGV